MNTTPAYRNRKLPLNKRVEDLLKRMTPEEKAAQLMAVSKGTLLASEGATPVIKDSMIQRIAAGGLGRISALLNNLDPQTSATLVNNVQKHAIENTRLGIPVLIDGEALHGCVGVGSTSYPQAIGLAAMWNPGFFQEIAVAIGREAHVRGMHQVLSPVCDIARDPRCGRTEETYGEDPYLASRMAVAFVKGVQSQRVIATPKHFVANFVGDGGRDSFPIHLTERLLREIYLPPYEAAVKEGGAWSIMSAYQSLDGMPCTANRWLLTDLLRGEWGFQGMVVSDWGSAVQIFYYHRIADGEAEVAMKTLEAGMDIELPEEDAFKKLPELLKSKRLPLKVLDEAARRVLRTKFWTGMFDEPYVDPKEAASVTNCAAHKKLALEAARQSIVLLANDGVLPLAKTASALAVIGPNASVGRLGGYSAPNTRAVSPLDGIKALDSSRPKVLFAEGCKLKDPDRTGFEEALTAARQAETVVMVMGNGDGTEGEQADRCNLDLPGVQEDLILEVAKANPNVVVVLIGGSAVTMQRWLSKVRAVVYAWYPGQEGGTALAEILFGDVCPSGKLPITFPRVTGQSPLYHNPKPSGRVYDYVDLRGPPAQFPFGHGLSYAAFQYSNLRIRTAGQGKSLVLKVAVTVMNKGACHGEEVVQLYIHDEFSDRCRPIKELKGFQRVALKPGRKQVVGFTLRWKDLAYLGHDLKPTLEPGNIEIMVGSSSEDIRQRGNTIPKRCCEAVDFKVSDLFPAAPDITQAPLPPADTPFSKAIVARWERMYFTNIEGIHGGRDGLVYLRSDVELEMAGKGLLLYGSDAPVRAWVNGSPVGCAATATNPISRDKYEAPVRWKKGKNELLFAVSTNNGKAWGVAARAVIGTRQSAGL